MAACALNGLLSVGGDVVELKSIKEVITKKETLAATHASYHTVQAFSFWASRISLCGGGISGFFTPTSFIFHMISTREFSVGGVQKNNNKEIKGRSFSFWLC